MFKACGCFCKICNKYGRNYLNGYLVKFKGIYLLTDVLKIPKAKTLTICTIFSMATF